MLDDLQISSVAEHLDRHICLDQYRAIRAVRNGPNNVVLPFSGNNSFVLKGFMGTSPVALRIFRFRRVAVIERYPLIEQKIKSMRTDYLQEFLFVKEGIEIDGSTYPIIISKWIQGTDLLSALENSDLSVIKRVKDKLREIFIDMEANKFFHGDLQHDNIMVDAVGEVKIFDFDGCYFDEISFMRPREFGSKHYTHRKRLSERIYDEKIDNFAKWSLYLSVCLIESNKKFLEYGRKDSLVFTEEDFVKPSQSELIRYLKSSSEIEVMKIFKFVDKVMCSAIYDDIPCFSIDMLIEYGFIERPKIVSALANVGVIPSWLKQRIDKEFVSPVSISASSTESLQRPSWIGGDGQSEAGLVTITVPSPTAVAPEWVSPVSPPVIIHKRSPV